MASTTRIELHDGNGQRIGYDEQEVSDDAAYQLELSQEMNDVHAQAVTALNNWGSLTAAQRSIILKNLVKWALYADHYLHLGMLK